MFDLWNPNTWEVNQSECRIYADDYANAYAVVDQIDYQYLIQWRWKLKQSKKSAGTKKPKIYLARSGHEVIGPDYRDEDGKRRQCRIVSTIFLHTVVMERTGIPKPTTDKKLIVDHKDSDEFNCRRNNLRWATFSFNARNRHGVLEHMLIAH